MKLDRIVRSQTFALGVALALVFAAVSPLGAEEGNGPPGYIRFVGENMVATANGEFKKWKITEAKVDPGDPSAGVVEIEIDVASLDTDNQKRDDHLRNPDFFEVEKYPKATVRVHSARKVSGTDDTYAATFDVTIRDVKKSIDGTFVVVSDQPPLVQGELTLDRNDFGVGEPHSSINPMSIGDEIPISFQARLPPD